MEKETIKIMELDFQDVKVPVFYNYDLVTRPNSIQVVFGARNPGSFYTGLCYLVDGKIKYHDDAIIPVQTEKDREYIPKFVIVGVKNLTEEYISSINEILTTEWLRRNKLTTSK